MGASWQLDDAVAQGRRLIADGADIVDVGGESSRPGAEPVELAEELRRVVPVIEALAPEVRVSIDTVKPEVARAAVAAGATLVNDVSASLAEVAAELEAGYVVMHRQGTPKTMQLAPRYDDVVAEVGAFLADRAEQAEALGIGEVWVDPGIGFGKTLAHNLALLRHLDQLVALGRPVLVGTSRKGFLGQLVARSDARALTRSDVRSEPTPTRSRPRPGGRAAGGLAGHGHLGHGPGRSHGPGPRCRSNRPSSESRGSMSPVAMKGKWAQGIRPRNFHWIIKDQIALCERPGGYGANHRRVRRQEEIIWIREQGFGCVISLIPAPHNLHNYDDLGVTWRHRPFSSTDDAAVYLGALYPEIKGLLAEGTRVLMHGEELGDRICGTVAGYLLWDGLIDSGPRTISAVEQITQRQLGPLGRELVAVAATL